MRREDRAVVVQLGFLHGVVHANILAIPVFLHAAWRPEFQADDVTLGLLAAVAYACFGLSSVPFGFLADRKAPAALLLVCAGGIAVSGAAIALSPSLWSLGASLAALGLSAGIFHPTSLSTISRTVREQGRSMGWHGMGGSLGIALGPIFASVALTIGWPWRATVGLLAVPAVLSGLLLAARPFPSATAGPAEEGTASAGGLATVAYARMILVYLFAGFAYQGALTFLPAFIGLGAFGLALGLGAIGQVLAGSLADRSRPDRILFALSLAAAALLIVLAFAGVSAAFTAAALGFGFFLFSLEALQNTLVTRAVPPRIRGLGFGLTFLSVFGLGSVGAAAAGWLIARGDSALLFLLLSGALAISGGAGLGVGASRSQV